MLLLPAVNTRCRIIGSGNVAEHSVVGNPDASQRPFEADASKADHGVFGDKDHELYVDATYDRNLPASAAKLPHRFRAASRHLQEASDSRKSLPSKDLPVLARKRLPKPCPPPLLKRHNSCSSRAAFNPS